MNDHPSGREHILYTHKDPEAPNGIKDSNGDIALAMCAVCKKAEADLIEPCLEDSVDRRHTIERLKAGRKYPAAALQPGGHPDYDVFDYAINEIVGLIRYAEMMDNRTKELWQTQRALMDEDVALDIEDFTWDLAQQAAFFAKQLIEWRQDMLKLGVKLGKPEERL